MFCLLFSIDCLPFCFLILSSSHILDNKLGGYACCTCTVLSWVCLFILLIVYFDKYKFIILIYHIYLFIFTKNYMDYDITLIFICICIVIIMNYNQASLVAQTVINLSAMPETWVWSLGWGDPIEKSMAIHSSILVWRIPMDRGALQATYSPWGCKESHMQKQLRTEQHTSIIITFKNFPIYLFLSVSPSLLHHLPPFSLYFISFTFTSMIYLELIFRDDVKVQFNYFFYFCK